MLSRRRTYLALLSLMALIALMTIACSSTESDSEQTGETIEEPTATQVSEPTIDPDTTPEPTSTVRPRATVTPTPEPEGTPVSDTESVGFYLGAFNSISRGEYVDAERTFTTVIEIEPGFARGWDGRGQALMLQGKYEEAMLDFDRAIELKPNLAIAYANRGLTRVALDDFDGAARDASRAFELDDESVAAQLVLGRVSAYTGDNDKALEWFDLAVVTDSNDGSTWWWRGRFYRDVLGNGNAALNDFNAAIELAPAQAGLYIDRALLYIQANAEPELARADLEEAVSLAQDPKLPHIIDQAEELTKVLDERAAASS